MIDLDKMIVSLRLSWIKRVFSDCGGTWKSYLINDLERYRGLSFCNCNYDVHDCPSFSVFLPRPLRRVDAIQRYF